MDEKLIEYENGTKIYFKNGLRHREDGPAVIYHNGYVEYFLNGISISEKKYEQEVIKLKLERLKKLN
jgi:hypothetical protein